MKRVLGKKTLALLLSLLLCFSSLTACGTGKEENDLGAEIGTEASVVENGTESVGTDVSTEEGTEVGAEVLEGKSEEGETTSSITPSSETFNDTAKNVTQSNVNDQVKSICNSIITSGMSDFQKVMAIHDWLTANISYDYTYSHYYVEETLRDRTGVCQGYALCFLEMATYVGLEATFVGGTANNGTGSGYQSHAWNQVKINGTWYNVDVTWDDPTGSDTPGYTYFLVSDSTLNKNHTPDTSKKTCSYDYPRNTIYQTALNSGKYGNAFYASSIAEFNAGIESYMTNGATSVWVWYYDTSLDESTCGTFYNTLISGCKYPVSLTSYYATTDGITKYNFTITPMSTWNTYPLATNASEVQAIIDGNYVAGGTYTFRYDSADKSFVMPAVNVPASGYSYNEYNSGYSRLLTIYYN